MSLDDHARAARFMAEAFAGEAESCGDERNAMLLSRISRAYTCAAADMDAAIKSEIMDHRCSIDHRTLSGPKCPACGAPKG